MPDTLILDYREMTPAQREAAIRFLQRHDIDPINVPVNVVIEYDAEYDEWVLPLYARDANGRMRIQDGDVVMYTVRRPRKVDYPE
jgi:hypothetical protein